MEIFVLFGMMAGKEKNILGDGKQDILMKE